ncbi:FAST kinase domain-containing protein 5, mitochondrial [Osmerus mordax]|uniref:FAST kinase domain-containing protein 5, mitochondrial n=1 Tax=Osmerus mordax TaxID=8014 RepID=UPI00350F9074
MYARVLYQRLPRFCHPSLAVYREVFWAQHQHRTVAVRNEEEGRDVLLLPQRTDCNVGYTLQYNPSSYQYPQHDSGTSLSRVELEEETDQTTLIPPFRQQINHYSVSSSRHLSSSKNTLLDLAFNRNSGGKKAGNASQYQTEALTPDIKGNPRAFQRCRPEYSAISLDLSQRPPPIQSKQAFLLLHKVTILKGSMEPSNVTDFLCKLGHLHHDQTPLVRGDTRFIMLLRYAVENLQYFTHTQLLEVLQSFVWLGLPSTHSMLGLYETEFALRAGEMTVHQLLLAADLWRSLRRSVPQYLERLFHCISLNLKQVGVPELVQLLYIMGEGRWCPKELVNPIEQLLIKYVEMLEPEEIGVVCLSLFKSQTSLSVGAVNRLVDKAVSVVKDMSDFALVNVLKLLRFSYLDHRAWLEAMEQEVPCRTPGMGVQGLMHIALACSALHYRNDHILLAIAERLPFLASHCRSKDSAKLLWAFGTLGVQPSQCPSLYPSLIEALRQRETEFQRYPEHLLTGLLGLAFVCKFPEDLLVLALSPEFVSLATRSKQLDLKKDLFTLDGTVALEFPHWTGPRLSRQLKEEVKEMLWNFAQSDVCKKYEVLEAESALGELLGGEEFVKKRMIIPHTRSIDLEVHLDSTGKPVVLATNNLTSSLERSTPFSKCSAGWERISTGVTLTEDLLAQLTNNKKNKQLKPANLTPQRFPFRRMKPDEGGRLFSIDVELSDGLVESLTKPGSPSSASRDLPLPKGTPVKLAIQVSNRNHYCYRSQQLLGLHTMKRRQLELVGYRVVELPHWEWFPLLRRSRAEKLAYLHCKVFSRLE